MGAAGCVQVGNPAASSEVQELGVSPQDFPAQHVCLVYADSSQIRVTSGHHAQLQVVPYRTYRGLRSVAGMGPSNRGCPAIGSRGANLPMASGFVLGFDCSQRAQS